jgi:hypothetical protein
MKPVYYYTYKLPFEPKKTVFTYWKANSNSDILNEACVKYKTTEFHMEDTIKKNYDSALHKIDIFHK